MDMRTGKAIGGTIHLEGGRVLARAEACREELDRNARGRCSTWTRRIRLGIAERKSGRLPALHRSRYSSVAENAA